MSIKTLEIFAGIGGIRLGFESVGGFEFAQAIEISASAKAVYSHHFADTPIWDDVRTFDCTPGEFDCIVGGSPCQDFSNSGAKQGLEGEQSSLWWEMLRIIDKCRPSFVGWENVEGALCRGAREVAASLRMVGYEIDGPVVISAAELGAPHQRKRIFIAAHANHLSLRHQQGFVDWEEQIKGQLAIARNSCGQGFQRSFSLEKSRGECNAARQLAPFYPPNRISQSPGLGLDDGFSGELVRRSADAPWLLEVQRSGWWRKEFPPFNAGIPGKRISGRRDAISHYGAACVPAQAIPLALRIKFLQKLQNNN